MNTLEAQNPFNLPRVGVLGDARRVRVLKVTALEVGYALLGPVPGVDADGNPLPETVVDRGLAVVGSEFADFTAVLAHIENPPPYVLTDKQAEALLDRVLDEWADERGYASAARCITYADDPDATFRAEGIAMRTSRSSLWVAVRAAASSPDTPPRTEANVRAFAAQFRPIWPS